MSIDFSIVSLLDFLAFIQGTLLGLLLIFKKRQHISYLFLGIFLFTYSAELLVSILHDTNQVVIHPQLLYLPISFYFLSLPVLYLYVKSLTTTFSWRKYYYYFIPAALEFILFSYLFLQPTATKEAQLESGFASQFYTIHLVLGMLFSIFFIGLILRFIYQHKKRVENYYSNVQGKLLTWVQWICGFLLAINAMIFILILLPSDIIDNYAYPIVSALNVGFIFWVALSGFQQPIIKLPEENLPKKDASPSKNEAAIFSKNKEEYEQIYTHIKEQKNYTQADLHLADLAKQTRISERRLSHLINEQSGLNFKQFINHFRVEEAQKLLLDEKFAHLNMLGIAYEVGFNSKATFYAVFKKETGSTPMQFQKSNS